MTINSCVRLYADKEQIEACKKAVATAELPLSRLSELFSLAGNEIRLKILYLLRKEKELCVCDLSDILGMSVSAISQHLRKLKDGKIVSVRKEGPTYYYYCNNEDEIMFDCILKKYLSD